MAWTETYHCDVCGIAKNEDQHDWWLAFTETISPTPDVPEQPVLRLTPWNQFLSHSSDVRHFCGARCVQTGLDRWMTHILELQHLALAEEAEQAEQPEDTEAAELPSAESERQLRIV